MTAASKYQILKDILATEETPLLGPDRRSGVIDSADVLQKLNGLLDEAGVSGGAAELARSLALLWHDHLHESHSISQSIPSGDGSYVHGIMHRREPDFGNAAYWFRRVGDHPIYPELAESVSQLGASSSFTTRLLNGDDWNPLAMIDACEAVDVGSADEGDEAFLREVQSLEFHLLLKRFCEL